MPYILQTDRLTKAIGGKNLVTNVSMHVECVVLMSRVEK